jgi:hypothetical protein
VAWNRDLTFFEHAFFGGAKPPGPLGVGSVPEKYEGFLGAPRGARLAKGGPSGKKAPAPTAVKEISVAGQFDNPFSGDLAKEIAAMQGRRWAPSTDDFVAVAGNAIVSDSLDQFASTILFEGATPKERPVKSLGRVNVFTHANPNLIAFTGTITPQTISSDVMLDVPSALSSSTLQTWNAPGFFLILPSNPKKHFTLDDIRSRFSGTDAKLVLYACHSGLAPTFLQKIADTFQVTVIGFKDVIAYCPTFTVSPLTVDRKHIGIGSCAGAVTDFHNLLNDSSKIVIKTPTPPTP